MRLSQGPVLKNFGERCRSTAEVPEGVDMGYERLLAEEAER